MSSPAVIEEMLADLEEFLDGPGASAEVASAEVSSLLEELAALGQVPAPVPGPQLAPYLVGSSVPAGVRSVGGTRLPASRRPHRGRRVLVGLAAAAVSSLTMTGVAAVANELPVGLQRTVAHFSEHYLPFALPRPAGDPPVSPQGLRGGLVRPGGAPATGAGADRSVGAPGQRTAMARPPTATGPSTTPDPQAGTGATAGATTVPDGELAMIGRARDGVTDVPSPVASPLPSAPASPVATPSPSGSPDSSPASGPASPASSASAVGSPSSAPTSSPSSPSSTPSSSAESSGFIGPLQPR